MDKKMRADEFPEAHIVWISNDLMVNKKRGFVYLDGKEAMLSMSEYQLLLLFVANMGESMPTKMLMTEMLIMDVRNFHNLIYRLRRKIGDKYIKSERTKGGYIMPYFKT